MEAGGSLPKPKGWPRSSVQITSLSHTHSGIMAFSCFLPVLPAWGRNSTPGTEAAGAVDSATSQDPLTKLSCPWSCSLALQAGKVAAQPPALQRSCAKVLGTQLGLGQLLAQLEIPRDRRS